MQTWVWTGKVTVINSLVGRALKIYSPSYLNGEVVQKDEIIQEKIEKTM